MNLLSIQSHVVYGHVGNSAAVFVLQRLGVEAWPVHTVQFSNHTGYGAWQGRVFDAGLIRDLVAGLEARGVLATCDGVLSGYIGSPETGAARKHADRFQPVQAIVDHRRVEGAAAPAGIAHMRGILHRHQRPDLALKALQREDGGRIADMAVDDMRLDGEDGRKHGLAIRGRFAGRRQSGIADLRGLVLSARGRIA